MSIWVRQRHLFIALTMGVAFLAVLVDAYRYYCIELEALGVSWAVEGWPGDPPPQFTLPGLIVGMWPVWVPWLLTICTVFLRNRPRWYFISMGVCLVLFVWTSLIVLADIHDLYIPLVPR